MRTTCSLLRRLHMAAGLGPLLVALQLLACAGVDDDPDYTGMSEDDFSAMGEAAGSGDYLRFVTVRNAYGDTYLMHWGKRKMPLSVYLISPPPGLFENPSEIEGAVRKAVLDWADVVSPGVPGFEFVDDQGEADIPIVWAPEPDGDWYIAFCALDVGIPNRFGVSHILVTGRWRSGKTASASDVYAVTLHEMGHALGLVGHSDDRLDVMYPSILPESDREMVAAMNYGSLLSPRDRNTLRKLYQHGNRPFRGLRRER